MLRASAGAVPSHRKREWMTRRSASWLAGCRKFYKPDIRTERSPNALASLRSSTILRQFFGQAANRRPEHAVFVLETHHVQRLRRFGFQVTDPHDYPARSCLSQDRFGSHIRNAAVVFERVAREDQVSDDEGELSGWCISGSEHGISKKLGFWQRAAPLNASRMPGSSLPPVHAYPARRWLGPC